MKILLVTTSLSCGGITSFLIPLANYLCDEGNEVELFYTQDEESFVSRFRKNIQLTQYRLPSKKTLVKKAIARGKLLDLFRLKFRGHKTTKHIAAAQRLSYVNADCIPEKEGEYDLAISSAEFLCNAYVAKRVKAKRKIGWVHPDLSTLRIDCKAAEKILEKLDAVVAVSQAGCDYLQRTFPERREDIFYIRNMLDEEYINERAKQPVDDFYVDEDKLTIVTVCRIENTSKRLDRAITVAERLKEEKVPFRWYIVGDGVDYAEIDRMIKERALGDCVILLGKKSNPYPYIKQADVFVLTSQYEGMPIVIEEAKLLGMPIITTAYSSAAEQLEGYSAKIVENSDGSVEKELTSVLLDRTLILKLQAESKSYLYSMNNVKEKLDKLLSEERV